MTLKIDRRRLLAAAAGAAVAGTGVLSAAACAQARPARVLTVFYSRTGHTRTIAAVIHRRLGRDLIQVRTVRPYPTDYRATVEQARRERDSGDWPPIATRVRNIRDHDLILLGSPVWGDHLNPPMKRFLADHDLSGMRIAPFVTYIVSGMGQVRRNIAQIAPRATILDGLSILGEEAGGAQPAVDRWLSGIGAA